jgi:hypothetical protein
MDQYGGEKKSKKSKKTKKTTKTTKSTKDSTKSKTKKSTKTTKTRSKAKGGNFLGTVGDLVAPTGWGPFATAAGLLALDRADAALRRGTKEKKEKMKGGECEEIQTRRYASMIPVNRPSVNINNKKLLHEFSQLKENVTNNPKYILGNDFIASISCGDINNFYVNIDIYCGINYSTIKYKLEQSFTTFDDAKKWLSIRKNQLALINLALLKNYNTCKNPDYNSASASKKT